MKANSLLVASAKVDYVYICNVLVFNTLSYFYRLNRHKGKLSRVITGIFWRKFDGHYFSWKVTPIATQERYFRNFAVMSTITYHSVIVYFD